MLQRLGTPLERFLGTETCLTQRAGMRSSEWGSWQHTVPASYSWWLQEGVTQLLLGRWGSWALGVSPPTSRVRFHLSLKFHF